jgi:MFS family permease
MYFNVFIYKVFNATPQNISAMVAASAVAATLTTVFMGALSDRVGKRKLFISAGYILWGISIFSFVFIRTDIIGKFIPATVSAASVGVTLVIILDCVMTFFGSTANDAAFNAWVTDSTDSTNRGSVEGINAMMPLVAILVVFGGFMFFNLDDEKSWTLIFSIIGAVVFLIGVLGLFLIKDSNFTPAKEGYFSCIFHGFKPRTIKANPTLYGTLICFAIFNISIQIFMPYLIIYYEKSLGMTDYVFIMAPAIILAAVCTAFWGKVYDKKGFKFSAIISLLWLCLGYVILFLLKTTIPVFIGSLFMMCGYLAGMAVFGAMIRDNTPENKAGMFQGLRIFSQVLIPGVVGPYIGAAVLKNAETILNSAGTSSFLPNEKIFLAALVAVLPLLIVLLFRKNDKKQKFAELTTPFEKNMPETPWNEYPRPSMKREAWLCLNGKWDFEIQRGDSCEFS